MAARTKTLWSNRKSTLRLGGRPARILGMSWRAWLTTVRVEVLPLLRMGRRAEWRPSRRTRLVWGLNPSWTKATSFTFTMAPFTYRTGILFRSLRISGLLLIAMSYSRVPIFVVPAGGENCRVRVAGAGDW